MENIMILGGGPAGMSAAFELNKAKRPFIVIEKNGKAGGLAKTLRYGEFITDIGPHRFFSQNKYLYDLIEDILGNQWITVNRLTRFYIKGKFFLYPVQLKDALVNVGLYSACKIISDFLYERSKEIFIKKVPITFEDQVVQDYGRSLAEFNMINYTEKIWGLPCSQISPDWAKQRIKGLSVMEILKKSLIKSNNGPKTLVDQFFYPEYGTQLIYDKIKERISNETGCGLLLLNSWPIKIIHNKDKITDVIIKNHDTTIYKPEKIISTIPITELIYMMEDVPEYVIDAVKNLKFRSHVSVFITINKNMIFQDQWLYFPERDIPFGRIMEPKNFSKKMSPENKTSLLIEYFCWENDHVWQSNKNELFELSMKWLEKLNFLKRENVIDYFVHKEKYAYPVYDLNYKEYLSIVKKYIGQFDNIQLIGRSGSFKYNNQDHALEMGILAARNIIEGKRYDTDDVGSEQEYFERGYVS